MLSGLDMRFWLKRAAEELMALGRLFVVARGNHALYEYFKQEFAGEPVTVVLDRREGERRQADDPHEQERRLLERRIDAVSEEALERRGFAVIAESEPSPTQPAHDGKTE